MSQCSHSNTSLILLNMLELRRLRQLHTYVGIMACSGATYTYAGMMPQRASKAPPFNEAHTTVNCGSNVATGCCAKTHAQFPVLDCPHPCCLKFETAQQVAQAPDNPTVVSTLDALHAYSDTMCCTSPARKCRPAQKPKARAQTGFHTSVAHACISVSACQSETQSATRECCHFSWDRTPGGWMRHPCSTGTTCSRRRLCDCTHLHAHQGTLLRKTALARQCRACQVAAATSKAATLEI
jgi:hypothetical protein